MTYGSVLKSKALVFSFRSIHEIVGCTLQIKNFYNSISIAICILLVIFYTVRCIGRTSPTSCDCKVVCRHCFGQFLAHPITKVEALICEYRWFNCLSVIIGYNSIAVFHTTNTIIKGCCISISCIVIFDYHTAICSNCSSYCIGSSKALIIFKRACNNSSVNCCDFFSFIESISVASDILSIVFYCVIYGCGSPTCVNESVLIGHGCGEFIGDSAKSIEIPTCGIVTATSGIFGRSNLSTELCNGGFYVRTACCIVCDVISVTKIIPIKRNPSFKLILSKCSLFAYPSNNHFAFFNRFITGLNHYYVVNNIVCKCRVSYCYCEICESIL